MDRIQALKERKEALKAAGKDIRAKISALVDEASFVELSAFSFSKQAFFEEETSGEGVITGFATIGGYPFYIVAQNYAQSFGGLSKANCEKIARALSGAEKQGVPVVYLLHSHGVKAGEGVHVLEGIAELLLKATQLKGTVLQFAVLDGEVYGSSAALASIADVVFFTEGASLCISSPFVLSAKAGKNLKPEEVGGYAALAGADLPAIRVRDMKEVCTKLISIAELLRIPTVDAELNAPAPELNADASAKNVLALLEDGVELGANACPEVHTVLGRLGGVSVAAVVMDGMQITAEHLRKIRSFAELACCYSLPFVTFVDCAGVAPTMEVATSPVLREMGEYLNILDAIDTAKIAVVTGRAVGLGYSLFAAKSVGFDYTFALATAEIALFDNAVGAEVEFGGVGDAGKLAKAYAEAHADPVHAAQGGYLDDIVEPQFLKQYLIAALETLK